MVAVLATFLLVTAGCGSGTGSTVAPSLTAQLVLSPDKEVPPVSVASNASGRGTVSLDLGTRQLQASGTFSGLTSPLLVIGQSSAHFHLADGPDFRATTGPIVFNFVVTPNADGRSGRFELVATLTDAQVNQFRQGAFYFNLHTELNRPGELRDQVQF